ncbi:MAG: thiaminase II [Bacteroidota bacterium]
MKWSQKAWEASLPLYEKILIHPFNRELMQGTLPKEKFEFYLQQDAFYLIEFGKVLVGTAMKMEDTDHAKAFLTFGSETIAEEQVLHDTYFKQFQTDSAPQASPTCLLYTSYMHTVLATKSLPEALGVVLPCFWIYKEVGDYIYQHQSKTANPYQAWIDTYAGEGYGEAVQLAIDICDEVASACTPAQQEQMIQTFLMSSKMEWMFWDSAYRLEDWPV